MAVRGVVSWGYFGGFRGNIWAMPEDSPPMKRRAAARDQLLWLRKAATARATSWGFSARS